MIKTNATVEYYELIVGCSIMRNTDELFEYILGECYD